jgi:hypothetical protein
MEKAFPGRELWFSLWNSREIQEVKMVEKNIKDKENINADEEALTSSEREPQGDLKEQRRPKKRNAPCRGKNEAETEGKTSQAKRGEVRKVATMVKRIKGA